MNNSEKESVSNLRIYLLQDYHKRGLAGRLGLIQHFIDAIIKNLEGKIEEIPDERFGLGSDQKNAMLQLGIISHLMMLTEDIAVFCTSFIKNESDYYKYLDKKEDEDLGKIIYDFYDKVDDLTNDKIRKILCYIHPDKYKFENEDQKNVYTSILLKNIKFVRYFLVKTSVFYKSHFKIFRRYKHAGFPVLLASKISKDDELLYGKFDFVSFAFTSKIDVTEEITTLPFSKNAVKSYQNYSFDIYLFLRTIINSRLISIERKIDGIFPYYDDYFSKQLSKDEKEKLEKIWKDFEKKNPISGSLHSLINPKGEYTAWYVNLDTYVKPTIELVKKQ